MGTEVDCEDLKENKIEALNAKLFSAIRKKQPPKEKLKQVMEYIKEGANVNSIDSSDNNNTLLHVAVTKGDVKIVKFLVDKGANATIPNNDNLTVLDIIQSLNTPNSTELCDIVFKKFGYLKRSGTSGVKGELYETKLLSLILLRAQCDKNVKEFILGTNLDGIGALDDIVLRYKMNDSQRSTILFIQAKHKENEKITVEDLLNPKKDINLQKYFQGYLRVLHKFATDNENVMFEGSMKNIDCKFIIYTTAKQYFTQNKNTNNETINEENHAKEKSLINASKNGKIFKFKPSYDCNEFAKTFTSSRPILLAQTLSKFILKDDNSYKNIMLDDLMKTYHVYLSQKVIILKHTNTVTNDYCIGEFRQEFLTSDEENFRFMRQEICKELAIKKGLTAEHQRSTVENMMKTLTFKLPVDFGSSYFCFSGDEAKKQSRVNHMCSIFKKIFQSTDSYTIKLDDNSVGPDEILQNKDLESHWLGGLVGNLLISDNEDTGMLKFNMNNDDHNLSEDCVNILKKLQETYKDQLGMFRFDINYFRFPKLSLNSVCCKEYDLKLVKDFFSKLSIYTNQAKEDEVEKVLMNDIYKLFRSRQKIVLLFRVKCDAIFLKVHDKIQKWWQQTNSAPYLTETCKFYQQVEQEILESPLLSIINFLYIKKSKSLLRFENEAVPSITLDKFFKTNDRIMVIISEETTFSGVKVIQYLNNKEKQENYVFIDFNHEIIEKCFENVLIELESSIVPTLVVTGRSSDDYEKIYLIVDSFKGKIIIIACNDFGDSDMINNSKVFVYKDNTNNFSSLSSEVRKIIFERQITFQGIPVLINDTFTELSLNLMSPRLLHNIISNEEISIGLSLADHYYYKTVNHYMKRAISRVVTLQKNLDEMDELCFIKYDDTDLITGENNEIVLITQYEENFEEICKTHSNSNIHWFVELNEPYEIVWKKSHGSIKTIRKYVEKNTFREILNRSQLTSHQFELYPTTLKDTNDRVVIISSDVGKGKSSLITHVALNTKRLFPTLWIVKINLIENYFLDQIVSWKDNNVNIDMKEAVIFLYSAISMQYRNNDILIRVSKLIDINNNNEIHLSDCDHTYLPEVDLTEIKLFNDFYNRNNVAVIFDGVDGLCADYVKEMVQLLCIIKNSNVSHLWITSRPYFIIREMELALKTFSFAINPFLFYLPLKNKKK